MVWLQRKQTLFFISPQSERRGLSIFAGIVSEWVSNWLLWCVSKGLLWSYIIIVSGMGDDVPILGAVVTLLKADGLLLFLMMLLYISMVRSSYIIIVSGMGGDVPILGALVTLLEAKVYCWFWWCVYTSVWWNHHISSLYLVWETTCQFRMQWWYFLRQWFTVVFDGVSIHQYGQIIIYHHCIWYGRWRANFGCSGDTFWGNGLL